MATPPDAVLGLDQPQLSRIQASPGQPVGVPELGVVEHGPAAAEAAAAVGPVGSHPLPAATPDPHNLAHDRLILSSPATGAAGPAERSAVAVGQTGLQRTGRAENVEHYEGDRHAGQQLPTDSTSTS